MTTTMKTVQTLAAEFIAQGCPAAQAFELAGKQFDRDSAIVAEQQKQAAAVTRSKNADGIECEMKRSIKGISMPIVTTTSAVLVAGGSNAAGTQFGPQLRIYTPQFTTSLRPSPDPVCTSSGSSQSSCEPNQVPTWTIAGMVAMSDCRLFIPTGDTEKIDSVDVPILEEFSDRREEWLHIVREEITMFFDMVAEERSKLPAKKARKR